MNTLTRMMLLLFVFLALPSLSFADDDAKLLAKLQKEFGYNLTHVPFFLRFSYYKQFNKSWKETDYSQRLAFLTDYEINLEKDIARQKAEAQAAVAKEKERLRQQKEKLRQEEARLKAQQAQEKAEKLAEKERQKEFDTAVKNQQKELHEMVRAARPRP